MQRGPVTITSAPPHTHIPSRRRLAQLEDLKQFRQWESQTPGHPENFVTAGVEVTTGKLERAVTASRWRDAECQRHLGNS